MKTESDYLTKDMTNIYKRKHQQGDLFFTH